MLTACQEQPNNGSTGARQATLSSLASAVRAPASNVRNDTTGRNIRLDVTVERAAGAQDQWCGRAHTVRDYSIHPGMVGRRPLFDLEHGRILLRSTESRLGIFTNAHFRRWGGAAKSASFEVGGAPVAITQQGDQLSFHKFGTGDLALTIMRNESPELGIGSLVSLPLRREIQVEEDARIKELWLYNLACDLDRIDDHESHVIWIDAGKPDLESQLGLMNRTARSEHLIVAIKESISEDGGLLVPPSIYDKLLDYDNADCISFYEVDARFADKDAWLNYIKELPRGAPQPRRVYGQGPASD